MHDLIQEAMEAAETLEGERMPEAARLIRRLAAALQVQSIELKSRTECHEECLGLVNQLRRRIA